jgi:predicted nuclease with TOPRIM domain
VIIEASSDGFYARSVDVDTISVMVDTIDVLADTAAEIADIRKRVRELDDERARLNERLEKALIRFTALAAGHTGMQPSRSIDPEILRVFQRYPDRYLTPRDVATAMSYRDVAHIRMRLSRMVKSKKLKRVGHGRYVAAAPAI